MFDQRKKNRCVNATIFVWVIHLNRAHINRRNEWEHVRSTSDKLLGLTMWKQTSRHTKNSEDSVCTIQSHDDDDEEKEKRITESCACLQFSSSLVFFYRKGNGCPTLTIDRAKQRLAKRKNPPGSAHAFSFSTKELSFYWAAEPSWVLHSRHLQIGFGIGNIVTHNIEQEENKHSTTPFTFHLDIHEFLRRIHRW